MTDRPDDLPGRPRPDPAATDLLSDVLGTVRLSGAMLFLVEAATPWKTQAPAIRHFRDQVLPRAQHLVSYHVVVRGQCFGGLSGRSPQALAAGDVLVVPHGDPYYLASPPDALSAYSDDEALAFFEAMAAGSLPSVVAADGGGAEHTAFLCGFLGCDLRPFNPVLAALPPVIHLRSSRHDTDQLSHLVDYAMAELRAGTPGRRDVLLRLSELMFVEVVRRVLARADEGTAGWLGALHDPLVARCLARLHAEPERAWTLPALAAAVGSSRSVIAARFARRVGRPPMAYLTAWRMQLAAGLLATGEAKVRDVGERVGYASEAAFSRAFRRHAGCAPSDWPDSGGPSGAAGARRARRR